MPTRASQRSKESRGPSPAPNKASRKALSPSKRRQLAKIFPEMASTFPRKISGVQVIGGRTLTRFGTWHKMAILVDNGKSIQVRLIGWHYRGGKWKFDQRFYLTGKNLWDVLSILQELLLHYQDGLPMHRKRSPGRDEND
jgi:hypothetical protein